MRPESNRRSRSSNTVSVFLLGALLAGCGANEPVAQVGASAQVSVAVGEAQGSDASALPTESPAAQAPEDDGTESHEGVCDLGADFTSSHVAVTAKSVSPGGVMVARDLTASTIKVDYDLASVVSVKEFDLATAGNADDVVTDLSEIFWFKTPFIDNSVIDELTRSDNPTLFVHFAIVGGGQVRPRLTAAASAAPDGSITLLGKCGQEWQSKIEAGAKSMGRQNDLRFLAAVSTWESAEALAVFNASSGLSAEEAWERTPPAQRSLDVRDVPRDRLNDYYLTGAFVETQPGLRDGLISLRTDQGVIATFAPAEMNGVIPMLIPRNVRSGSFYFVAEGSSAAAEGELIGTVELVAFDETLGALISIAPTPLTVSVAPLVPGELEKRMGVSREDIEAIRRSMLE
jgi:hypothetical protein